MEPGNQTGRRADLAVFAGLAIFVGFVCCDAYAPDTYIFRDGSFYAQTNRSIARSFTLRQEEFQPASWYDGSLPWYRSIDDAWSNVSVGPAGEWYPKHSYLMPVMSTPLYVLFGTFGLLLFNASAMVLALFAGYRLAALYAGRIASAVAVLVVASAPLVRYLAYSYSHDVFCAALVAGGLALLAHRRWAIGGFILGLSLYARMTNVLIAVPVGLALTLHDRRGLVRAMIAGSVPLLIFGIANAIMFGSPFTTSYNRILTVADGRIEVVSYTGAFDVALIDGWNRFFTPSAEGELGQMALLPLFAFAAIPLMSLKAWRPALGLGVSVVAFLITFAKYRYGGARFFMPWLAVSTVPLAALTDRVATASETVWNAVETARPGFSRRLTVVSAAVLLAAFAVFWVASRPGGSRAMSGDVERIRTSLDGIPCDYFNMTHDKWECSRVDPDSSYFVGRPKGGQCEFAGRPMVWVPANPAGKRRTISWAPAEPAGSFVVHFGLDPSSRSGQVRFSVTAADGTKREFIARDRGVLSSESSDVFSAGPSAPLTITVEPGAARGLYLCLDIEAG